MAKSDAWAKQENKLDAPLVQRLTPEQKDLIKRQYAKFATDDELAIYYNFCEKAGVDPMRGQSHFIKFNATAKPIMMIGIDGFQARVVSDPRYEGMVANAVYQNDNFLMNPVDGVITHTFGVKERGTIAGAYAILKRKGMINSIQWVQFKEYNNPSKDNWKNMPEVMITKVARATLIRREYPDNFSGVYVPEEFGMEITDEGEMKGAVDVTSKKNVKSLKEAEKEIITTTTEPPYQYQDIPSDTSVSVTITEPTPELKVIPNDPLPSTKKPRGRPKAEVKEEAPESDDDKGYKPRKEATREPEAEPEQVKESTQEAPGFKSELQLSPSAIKKMEGAESPRMAFEIMNKYAFQGQGHHLKALVRNFCPEFFDRGYSIDQIPETALIEIIKCASCLIMKAVEKTPKCKSKGCKNLMTEPEKELHKGVCWECFAKESED